MKAPRSGLNPPKAAIDAMLHNTPCGLVAMEPDGFITWVNDKLATMLGAAPGRLVGLLFQELLTGRARVLYRTSIEALLITQGAVGETPLSFVRDGQSDLPVNAWFRLKRAPDGAPAMIQATVLDATNYTSIDTETRDVMAQSRQLEAIIAASGDAIISMDLSLEILSWSPGAARMFGYAAHEAIGRRAHLFFVPKHKREEMIESYAALQADQAAHILQSVRRHKDGHLVDVEINAAPMLDCAGNVVAFAVVLRDITQRLREVEALRTSHNALRSALDVAGMALWAWNETLQTKAWSAEALAIVGLPAETTMTRKTFVSLLHKDDVARYEEAWAAALDPNGPRIYSLEYRIRRANDGTERWIASKAVVEFDGNRASSVIGALRDITEERAAQQHVTFLLDEMNHRAKNLLSVVQAVAQQTARHGDPAAFVERLSNRLAALGRNQDLLVQNSASGVGILEFIRAQLAPFGDLLGQRILLGGPAMILLPSAIQAIGLALHELATNAAKYGALSGTAGRVDIAWWREEEFFRLSWRESGGPVVEQPTHRGFGQSVLVRMVEQAVRGEVDIAFLRGGLRWRLRAPLGAVVTD